MENVKFIPMMQKVYNRLETLAHIETMNEAERIEEQKLTRLFYEMLPLNDRIKYNGIVGYDPRCMTETQARIMRIARYQTI